MNPHVVKSALALGLALLVTGCSDPAPDAEVATFEDTDLSSRGEITVRALFVGPALGGAAATVEHEEIPGVMPAMRMDVALGEADLIDGLAAGDRVRMTIVQRDNGTGFIVTEIAPLPEGTVLDLEGSGADSAFVPGA